MKLIRIFEKDLSPEGYRGDKPFWELLKKRLRDDKASTVEELKDIIFKVFYELTAVDILNDTNYAETITVAGLRTEKVGMSACNISLEEWITVTIPALLKTFEELLKETNEQP